jgi:S-formylglutathione hydrolase FrmB
MTSIERYVMPYRLAVICPAVHRSYYTDMKYGYKYWSFVSEELPAIMQSFFRISHRRNDTFVAGLSMGGYGAFKLALRQPRRFAAAASLSGVLDLSARIKQAQQEDEERTKEFSLIFGENLDITGTDNDLFELAVRVSNLPFSIRPLLYVCCGTSDTLYDGNVKFVKHARKLGLNVRFVKAPGGHEWSFWDHWIQSVLKWLPINKKN